MVLSPDSRPRNATDIRAHDLDEQTSSYLSTSCQTVSFHRFATIMANGEDDRKGSWSSWFAPGDVRRSEEHRSLKPDTAVERPPAAEHEPGPSQGQPQDASRPGLHPLIAFKHFVDDSFAAITEFSDNLSALRQAAQDRHVSGEKAYEARQALQDEAFERWAGPAGSRAHMAGGTMKGNGGYWRSQLTPEETAATAKLLVQNSEWENRHVDPSRIAALFEDSDFNPFYHGEENSPWPFLSGSPSFSNNGSALCRNAPSPTRWLSIDWFKHSPYSPVNLEADPKLGKYDTKWRHAFEDLLEAALDKPITSRERFGNRGTLSGTVSTWRGPGLDWMLSLQCRGILPPQLPSMYKGGPVNASFFDQVGLFSMMQDRWGTEQRPYRELDNPYLQRRMLDGEWAQLLEEIGNPAPQDGTIKDFRPPAEELDDYHHKMAGSDRQHRRAMAIARQEQALAGQCPDELGRAVGEAINASHEPDTELDFYEQLYNDWSQESTHECSETAHLSDARCPDDLGRAVGDAARREAECLFADEENALAELDNMAAIREHYREQLLDQQRPKTINPSDNTLYAAIQMQLMLQDQQNKQRLLMARQEQELELQHELFAAEAEAAGCGGPQGTHALQGHRMQLLLQEQQNKQRLLIARQKEQLERQFQMFAESPGSAGAADSHGGPSGSHALQDYQNNLILLEQQNQKRLLMARQGPDSMASELYESRTRDGRCPDDLGRAVGDAARQEAARAFVDEENGLVIPDEKFSAALDQFGGARSLRQDLVRELQALAGRQEGLAAENDGLMMYIEELHEQMQALRDSQNELSEELSEAREVQFEQQLRSQMVEQDARQSAISPPRTAAQPGNDRPQVLSTMTTTQTTRLPDGSVKTTVVLKRRFADGFEETQESTQTSFDDSPTSNAGGQEPSKKGWFWS